MGRRRHSDEEEHGELSDGGPFAGGSTPWRRAAIVPLILVSFAVGMWMIWSKYKSEVLDHESYRLDTQNITYTPPPPWLRRDILAEVVKNGSLESRKIHETGLTVLVANAFEHHPWVKRVVRVRLRYPAKLDVELDYRAPIAMVALPDDDPNDDEVPRLPIDAEAFLLPPEDFIDPQTRTLRAEFQRRFPRIDVGGTGPAGADGTSWGSPIIQDAAKLAEVLYGEWESLQSVLYQIERSSQPTTATMSPDFDIRGRPDLGPTPPGLLVHWGRAPGKELANEPTADAKLAKLKSWIDEHRLRGQVPLGELDLRSARDLQARSPRETSR